MVFVSIFNSVKNQLQSGIKWKKVKKIFLITSFAKKNPDRKSFDVILSLKRNVHKPRKTNETINLIFGLGHEI